MKVKCFKRNKIITTLFKFVVYKFERRPNPWWDFEYALHLKGWRGKLFANFIQGAAVDHSTCSSYSL